MNKLGIKSRNWRRTKYGLISNIYNNQRNHSKWRGHPPPSYSRAEFHKWMNEQSNFNKLYNDWVESGYDKRLIPSADRIDDYISYRLDNLRLVIFKVNWDRSFTDKINGINNKNSRSVSQYEPCGAFIKTYYSLHNAWRETGIQYKNIHKVCQGDRNKAGGYIWSYDAVLFIMP